MTFSPHPHPTPPTGYQNSTHPHREPYQTPAKNNRPTRQALKEHGRRATPRGDGPKNKPLVIPPLLVGGFQRFFGTRLAIAHMGTLQYIAKQKQKGTVDGKRKYGEC